MGGVPKAPLFIPYDPCIHNQKMTNKKTTKQILCENCEETEVEHEGEWCDDCNLPERSSLK